MVECPEEVSIGKMRGTSCSSLTLLNVTHTTPVRAAQHHQHFLWWSSKRESISGLGLLRPHVLLFFCGILLLANLGICTGKRLAQRPIQQRYNERQDYYAAAPYPYNNVDYDTNGIPEREDLSEVYINEKDTDVKTIRFAEPDEHRRKSHKKSHHSKHPQKYQPESNVIQKLNLNGGDYLARDNEEGGSLENNDVQKIGMSTRALKSLAEQVADSILAEADKLYSSLQKGSSGESAATLSQILTQGDTSSYAICGATRK